MTAPDLSAIVTGIRKLLDDVGEGYAPPWEQDGCEIWGIGHYPWVAEALNDSPDCNQHAALIVAAVNALPALCEHATDVLQRHWPVDGYPNFCNACIDDRPPFSRPWPCPEIASLTALLAPFAHLAEEVPGDR